MAKSISHMTKSHVMMIDTAEVLGARLGWHDIHSTGPGRKGKEWKKEQPGDTII